MTRRYSCTSSSYYGSLFYHFFTFMEEMERGGDNFINHVVLSIMKKYVGSAIDAMHKLLRK
jgi:hypothetical protein